MAETEGVVWHPRDEEQGVDEWEGEGGGESAHANAALKCAVEGGLEADKPRKEKGCHISQLINELCCLLASCFFLGAIHIANGSKYP